MYIRISILIYVCSTLVRGNSFLKLCCIGLRWKVRSICPSRMFVQESFVGPGKFTHEVTLPRGTSALKVLVSRGSSAHRALV